MKDQNTESTVPEGQHECNRVSEYNNYFQLRVIAWAGLRKGPPQMFCPHLQQGFRGWRRAAPSITEGASKNDNIYNSLFTENCIDKQMGKCLWLGTRIICGDWCFCDWSDSTKDIALSRPPRMRSKTKTIALKMARLNFAKEPEKKPEKCWQHILWSDETKIILFGSDGSMLGVDLARMATVLHNINCETWSNMGLQTVCVWVGWGGWTPNLKQWYPTNITPLQYWQWKEGQ